MRRPCIVQGCVHYANTLPPEFLDKQSEKYAGAFVKYANSRCIEHAKEKLRQTEAKRIRPPDRGYGGDWRRNARRVVDEWLATQGLVCPGWQCDAHEVSKRYDLCVDHDVGILCRRCNGRKGYADRMSGNPTGAARNQPG